MSAVHLDQCLSLARSALLETVCRCCLRFRLALALLLGPFHLKISKYFLAQHLWQSRPNPRRRSGVYFTGLLWIVPCYLPSQRCGGWVLNIVSTVEFYFEC